MSPQVIYKVMSQNQWAMMRDLGIFHGAAIDLQDGYIHLSAADQLVETVVKHFHGQSELVVIAVDVTTLGDHLRWEVSRGGALFPHLYAPLPLASVVESFELPISEDGSHLFPAGPWIREAE